VNLVCHGPKGATKVEVCHGPKVLCYLSQAAMQSSRTHLGLEDKKPGPGKPDSWP
jgi:hypothetical protein